MHVMRAKNPWTCLLRALALLPLVLHVGSVLALGVPGDPGRTRLTPEQRQQMAETHRKMAECLVSTRPFAECRAEMHASCQANHADGCPMMGGPMGPGGMGRGMGMGMRQGPGAMDAPPTPPSNSLPCAEP